MRQETAGDRHGPGQTGEFTGMIGNGRNGGMEGARQARGGQRELLALLIGGLLLVAAVWTFSLYLGNRLANVHMRHAAAGVARQAAEVLRETGATGTAGDTLPAGTRTELRRLMKYRDVMALEIVDRDGRILWSSGGNPATSAMAAGFSLHRLTVDGLPRTVADARVPVGDVTVGVRQDVTGILGWYNDVFIAVAKAVTTVILAGFLVTGAVLLRRQRENAEAETALQALRRRNAEEHERVLVLQAQLERLNADMAELTRRLGRTMKESAPQAGQSARRAG